MLSLAVSTEYNSIFYYSTVVQYCLFYACEHSREPGPAGTGNGPHPHSCNFALRSGYSTVIPLDSLVLQLCGTRTVTGAAPTGGSSHL